MRCCVDIFISVNTYQTIEFLARIAMCIILSWIPRMSPLNSGRCDVFSRTVAVLPFGRRDSGNAVDEIDYVQDIRAICHNFRRCILNSPDSFRSWASFKKQWTKFCNNTALVAVRRRYCNENILDLNMFEKRMRLIISSTSKVIFPVKSKPVTLFLSVFVCSIL